MIMEIIITQTNNVDYSTRSVIDSDKVQKYSLDWEHDIKVYDVNTQQSKNIKVNEISLFNHRIIMNNDLYQVIQALSK